MIAIIAILAGMLLPALNIAREKAWTVSCTGKIKQAGMLLLTYSHDWNTYLPSSTDNPTWPLLLSDLGYLANPNLEDNWKDTKSLFRCPTGPIGRCNSKFITYGMRNTLGRNATFPDLHVSIGKIKTPSGIFWIGDTYSSTFRGQFYYFDGGFAYYAPALISHTITLHLRHAGAANMFYLDGHTGTHKAPEIVDIEKKRERDADSRPFPSSGLRFFKKDATRFTMN